MDINKRTGKPESNTLITLSVGNFKEWATWIIKAINNDGISNSVFIGYNIHKRLAEYVKRKIAMQGYTKITSCRIYATIEINN